MNLSSTLLSIGLCVLTEAFFSGSEIAMLQANRLKLEERAKEGHKGAQKALALLADESALLGTCLIGTNLSMVIGSTLVTYLLLTHGIEGAWAPTLAYLPIVLIFGEALPKTVFQYHADRAAPVLARPLSLARTLLAIPLIGVKAWTNLLTWFTGKPSARVLSRHALLKLIGERPAGEDTIDEDERKLIAGVLSLPAVRVDEVMTPLIRVVAIDENATIDVAAETAAGSRHTRLPIYRNRIDNIVGIIHQTDLLFAPQTSASLREQVRHVRFVPDSKHVDDLLREMREEGEHFAIVVDEYGGCVGIVTLEDLLEQFVGDIEDERDAVRPEVIGLPGGSWRVPGTIYLEDVTASTGLLFPDTPVETIAGFVLEALGHIPLVGEHVSTESFDIIVLQATDRAIKMVQITPLEPGASPASSRSADPSASEKL